jgi:hypothetical protein
VSQSTPVLPKPQPETVALLQPPWWKRPATWTAMGAGLAGAIVSANQVLIEVAPQITPLLNPKWQARVTGAGIVLAALASHLNGWRGVNASARVLEVPGNNGAADVPVTRGDLSSTLPSLLPQGPGARNPGA